MAQILLIRHGETAWSLAHRHTSYTDLDLTDNGVAQARLLAERLTGHRFAAVLVSPRLRARHTARLAGLTATSIDEDLAEWNYGRYEGLTTAQIRRENPDWYLCQDGCPDGESPAQVGARLDHVLDRARTHLAGGDVALVAHAHSLRTAGARWIGLPPAAGALLRLDTASISSLGHEHGRPVILRGNQPPTAATH